ncbi:FG-GAP-like repeat-containing protein [Streptomyces sp. NPDC048603]|uniref:FG-GAP-like repeat-containing protein n=1 Tax=Streptomyces sp. NPDC048603 TaxID=3365577 RepID=UPI0037126DFD
MRRKTSVAVAVVAAAATALPVTVASAGSTAAAPAAPAEYVIPARADADITVKPILASSLGYVMPGKEPGSHIWRTYTDAQGTPLVVPAGTTLTEGGPNSLAFVKKATGSEQAAVTFRDMRNGAESVVVLPAGHTFQAVVGDAVLSSTEADGGVLMHWLAPEDGKTADRPVTGLPAGAATLKSHSASGALVEVGGKHFLLMPEGRTRPAPQGVLRGDALVQDRGWSPDRDTWEDASKTWDIRGSLAEEDGKESQGVVLALVGRTLLTDWYSYDWDTGAGRQVFTEAAWSHALPGDRLVVAAKAPDGRHAVQLVHKPAQGTGAQLTKLLDTPLVPREVHGLAMDNGVLHTADSVPGPKRVLSRYAMPSAGLPQAGRWDTWASSLGSMTCDEAACPTPVPTGAGGVLFSTGRPVYFGWSASGVNEALEAVQAVPGTLQASGRFIAYTLGTDPQKSAEVFDLNAERKVRTVSAPGGTFALSGYWLWREKSAGALEAVDVLTGKPVRTETVADCDIKALEAWASSVYWKCDTKAGVYDTGTKKTVQLPTHNSARLGNGFVAWETNGIVKSTDLRGTTGTRDIGKPAHAAYARGWTVDRYSGRIAYRDAGHGVHVVDAGVVNGNIVAIDRDTPDSVMPMNVATEYTWRGRWYLNKPASSWTLTIRRKATGEVVSTLSGSDPRSVVDAHWNGRDRKGKVIPNGVYDWTLTGKPADGAGPELKSTGSLRMTLATPSHRDMAGFDSLGDLVTLDAKGALTFHGGDGKGGLTGAKVTGSGWPATSSLVPVGDVNKDGCNDVLVRNAAGELRSYQPACGAAVTPATPSRPLGKGFNAYDVLTSPGTVTYGAYPDLVGREAATGDLYRFVDGGLNRPLARQKISGGWKAYKQLVGAGDLNGDGYGDLLAVDPSNTLWRFDGAWGGTFKARVQVNGAGWANGRVQFIGVGDITGDGKPDVVSRNAAGELLRNSGDGKGGLGATTKIATGFGGYKGLY